MAKTEAEIIEAHRTTLEALTGKKCVIELLSREEEILKTKSLVQIKNAIEKIADTSILAKKKTTNNVRLRKIFCLLASYGSNQNQIRKFLQVSYDLVRYYLRNIDNDMDADAEFKKQFDQAKALLLSDN